MVDSSSENVAEIQARSEFQFLQEEGDLLVAVQFTDGAFSPVSPSEVTLVAPEDTSIYSVQGSILTAIGSGEAVGQFEWNPLSGQCSLNLVDYFLVSSRLPIPAAIQTSLLPLPAVHYLTTSTDQAALLVGLPSSLSISVSLLFPSGRTLDVSHDSRVSYSSSSPALMVSNGIITASEEATTQLVVSYATAEVNLTAVINIQVVVSVGITPSAYPYPTYPGSTSTNLVQLSLIESTGVWQRAVLDVRLILSNGTSIDVTSFSETQFRANALPPGQAIPETDITLSPLPVLSVRGGIGIVEVVAIFSPHISTLTISILNNRVFINAVEVLPFPQDTLRGIRGSTTQTVSVHLTFTDGTRFISYPNNPAFLGQMLAGLVNYSTTDNSFTVSSMGELQPLANSHLRLTLRVAAVSNMSVASNYNFVVNLDPEVGDVDIGMRTGSAIPASSVGSQLNLPVVINSGSSSVGSVDLLVTYDATIIEPTQVTMGPDFGSGIYEASLNDPPGELRLGGAFSTDIFGTSLHLFNINVRFLAPTFPEGSFLRGTVITLATRAADGSSIGLPTPRPMVAGNLTFSVSGRSKRSSMEGVAAQSRQQTHFRHRRQATCSAPPCACSWMTPGDTDGNCLFDVRDVSFILLYINQALVGSSGMAVTTPAQLSQLDPNQDGIVDTSDAFFLLRALFRLIYFMDNLSVTAVQNPLSQCLFSVNVQLRSAQELPLKAADVIIDFGFPDSSSTIVARDVVTGDFLTSDKGNGLNGALVLAQQSSDRTFNVQLNATFVSDSVGVSVVLVTFDALNATTSSRSVQFFGRPPPLYPSPLSLSLSLRGASVLVAASSGYSPFQFASNAIPSAQCSNIPILGPDLNVTFVSPFLAELSWILLNLREGLNFSMELKLQVATCEVSQDEEILNDTCSGIVVHDVRGSTFHDLPTKPFTLYYLQVSAPTSATDNITAQSPESPPMGLAPPLYSQKPDSTSFRWSLPALPNGVITHYVLYVGSVAVYNGSALSFSSTIVFQDTASVVLEAHNRAGSTRSDSILVSPIIGPDPGVRGLSLAAEEAIVIAIVLTGVIILVLVIVMLFGMWRRRMTEKAKKKPDFLSSNFEPENFEVEMGPLVLLPLNAQKEKHFEEKFAKEKNTTFWYQDERNIELSPAQFESCSSSGEDSDHSGKYNFDMDEAWGFGGVLSEKNDMSDLWVTEDLPPKKRAKKYSVIRKTSAKKKKSDSPSHRLSGSSFLRRLSFSQQRDDEIALITHSEEPAGRMDAMTETEMMQYQGQIRRLSDSNLQGTPNVVPIDRIRKPELPPPSDETSAQLAARLRAALREGRDMAEYRDLIAVHPTSQPTQAKLSFNSSKNRYRNVLPCDETRVKLRDTDPLEEGSDYINASYLDGHGRARAYIATQGPLPNTIDDFWKMVWEQGSEVVVMVTQLEDKGRVKSEKYWPDKGHSRQYGGVTITCTNQMFHEGYVESKFLVSSDSEASVKRSVTHYHYTQWPDFGCPPTKPLVEMVRKLGTSKPDKPMIIHCSAGLGRTGVLATMHSVLECHVDRRHVDVHRTVAQLRQQREGMVQTQQQYKFCYEAIAEALVPSENMENFAPETTFRPTSIPPPPYSESKPEREGVSQRSPMDTSMNSSLPSPPPSEQTTPIKTALVDTPTSASSASASPIAVEEPKTSEISSGEEGWTTAAAAEGETMERKRRTGATVVTQVHMEAATEKEGVSYATSSSKDVLSESSNEDGHKSFTLPGVMVTAPSMEALNQTVLRNPSVYTPSLETVPSSSEASAPSLPPVPPDSPSPKTPESSPLGFSIGDDQILAQKPSLSKEDKKPAKPSNQPQWKQQSGKTASPSLGKWKQQQQQWREKQTQSSAEKKPPQQTWAYKRKQEEEKAAKAAVAHKQEEEKVVKTVEPTSVKQNTDSSQQSSTPKHVRKLKIPDAFSGASQTSQAPPLRPTPTSTFPRVVQVAVTKSVSSHPTPPSSPSVVRKKWGAPATTPTEQEQVKPVAEEDAGDTPVMRRIKELQKKSAASSSLASAPVYRLPINKGPRSNPEKLPPSPSPEADNKPSESSSSTRTDASSHSADTSTGNVARLLARFQ